jgi:hypothetical protein
MQIISTDEDPILRIESFAIINLRGVSTKLNLYCCSPCKTTKNLSALLVNNIDCYIASVNTKRDWLICSHVALDKCNVSRPGNK